jgi:hypothetical protein
MTFHFVKIYGLFFLSYFLIGNIRGRIIFGLTRSQLQVIARVVPTAMTPNVVESLPPACQVFVSWDLTRLLDSVALLRATGCGMDDHSTCWAACSLAIPRSCKPSCGTIACAALIASQEEPG